jgi:hypothetical protein
VIPCNTDVATQTIIRFASEVDPKGQRTLGVLTKPDLAVETATKNAVADLVRGRRQDLKLGYCIVRNRGADDHSATLDAVARDAKEREFFSQPPWNTLDHTRVGIPALRSRLRTLLVDRTRTEFPNVKKEMLQKLKEAQQMLHAMGEARSSQTEQVAYLCKIAGRFSVLAEYARNAYYSGDPVFAEREDLRLITRVRELNEKFAKMFFNNAHRIKFDADADADNTSEDFVKKNQKDQDGLEEMELRSSGSSASAEESEADSLLFPDDERGALYPVSFRIPTAGEEDLHDILADSFSCKKPLSKPLLEEIETMYDKSRGYELGTVSFKPTPLWQLNSFQVGDRA